MIILRILKPWLGLSLVRVRRDNGITVRQSREQHWCPGAFVRVGNVRKNIKNSFAASCHCSLHKIYSVSYDCSEASVSTFEQVTSIFQCVSFECNYMIFISAWCLHSLNYHRKLSLYIVDVSMKHAELLLLILQASNYGTKMAFYVLMCR